MNIITYKIGITVILISEDIVIIYENVQKDFRNGSSSKESACIAGSAGDTDSIPESGRSPGVGNGNPLQYSCLGNHMDREASGATVHGTAKKLGTT